MEIVSGLLVGLAIVAILVMLVVLAILSIYKAVERFIEQMDDQSKKK